MNTATIQPDFNITIPQEIIKSMSLKAGQTIQIYQNKNKIQISALNKIKDLQGFLTGINTDFNREKDRI
ncbi:MAG: AbrB family transcriptional regulator [Gammaproteobacteria bacterium]|nr:MAG: AbrB family transcriptional regulator [Gammaproteobacteria bacterium]